MITNTSWWLTNGFPYFQCMYACMYVCMPTKDCRVKCRKLTCLSQINVQGRLLWAQHPAIFNA